MTVPPPVQPRLVSISAFEQRIRLLIAVFLALTFVVSTMRTASAETVRYDFTAANSRELFIRSSLPGQVFNDFQLRVGGWGDTYQTLLYFPVDTLPQVATRARLFLYCYGHSSGSSGSSVAMDLHRVTSAWDNTATWNSQPASVQVTALPAAAAGNWYEIDITTFYNLWKSGTPNFGLKLTPQGINNQWNEFYSADHTDAALKPYVLIDYVPQGSTTQNTHRASLVRAQSQYFSAPDSPSLSITGDLTIEAWVNISSQPQLNEQYWLVSKYSGVAQQSYWMIYHDIGGTRKVEFGVSPNGTGTGKRIINVSYTLAIGEWHHIACVYRAGSKMDVFVNGVSVGSEISAIPSGIYDSNSSLKMGATGDQSDLLVGFASAYLDETRVWSVARTQAEIRTTMFSELLGTEAGLRAYWKLNDSLADSSPNGNALTNVNAATFATNDLPFSSAESQLPFCPDRDTRALYHLDTSSADASGNGLNGNATGVVYAPEHGKFGSGAAFNGTTSVIDANANVILPNTSFSIATWLKGSGWFCEQTQAQALRQQLHCYYGPNEIYFRFFADDLDVSLPNDTSAWTHVVLTHDSSTRARRIYRNGILVASDIAAGNLISTGNFRIGSQGSARFSGSIDDFAVFTRSLTPEEIAKYYGGIVSARFAPLLDEVLRSDRTSLATWSTLRGGATTASSGDPLLYLCRILRNSGSATGWRDLHRSVMHFDSSGLPDQGIAINRAAIDLRIPDKGDPASSSLVVVPSTVISNSQVAASDFDRYSVPELAARKTFASFNIGKVNRIELNDAGQDHVGTSAATKFFFLVDRDFDNSEPPEIGDRFLAVDTSESANERPSFLVEYRQADGSGGSISGTVGGVNLPAGIVRIVATPTSAGAAGATTLGAAGPYSITVLAVGIAFNVTAYVDENNNQTRDPLEWAGNYAANPLLLNADKTGINITITAPVDADNDGLPDAWEIANGLTVGVNDAALDRDGDGLNNAQECGSDSGPTTPIPTTMVCPTFRR